MSGAHVPVLLPESLEAMRIKPDGYYIDATFGRGGHTQAILENLSQEGRLMVIDQDPAAIKVAMEKYSKEPRVAIKHGSFSQLAQFVEELGWIGKVDGLLMDLGVSSPQLDDPERGFSFLRDGPLDMRMDPTVGRDATFWINSAAEKEIAQVLRDYGDERHSRRIAKAIVNARAKNPIERTVQLADIVSKANPSWEQHKHPATRSFLAIRLFINQEMEALESCLAQSLDVLNIGGRLAVISFHSTEDRIVKNFIRDQVQGDPYPKDMPVTAAMLNPRLRKCGKPIYADSRAVSDNPRARSAVLRVAEKIS